MKIIFNADDFGMTHEANLGIEKAMQEGYCSQTSVVANTNYFDEAVEIAQKHGFMDKVGLHINLFDGTPLTGGIKKLKKYARSDMFDYRPGIIYSHLPFYKDEIGEELEAQIQKNGTYLLEVDVEPCDDQILGMLSAQQGILKIEKEGRRFMITSKKDIRPQLTKFLGEHDYTVMHLHQRGGDLDEIYRRYFEKAGQNDESNESKTKKKYSWKHKSGSN